MVPTLPSFWMNNDPQLSALTIIGQALHTETGEALFVAQLLSKAHKVILITQKELQADGYHQIESTRKNPNTFAMQNLPSNPGVYRHFKGHDKLYEVYGTAYLYQDRMTRTRPLVLYSPMYGDHKGLLTARPYLTSRGSFIDTKGYGFFDWVFYSENEQGYTGPRFKYVGPMESSMHPLLYKPFKTD